METQIHVFKKISVFDTTSPSLICPVDTTINCETPYDTITLGNAQVFDNCIGNIVLFKKDVITQGNCPSAYLIERNWMAIDVCGNNATCIQMIMVQDTTKPVITFCPKDTTINCNTPIDSVTLGTLTATDNLHRCADEYFQTDVNKWQLSG